MISWHLQSVRYTMPVIFIVLTMVTIGCAAIGPPISPEDVGIEAKVRKQQRATTQDHVGASENLEISGEEDTVELPAFYPIGTR